MLNYENVSQILPHTIQLVNSKYETHILAGLKGTLNILKVFGPQLIQLKTVEVSKNVDLAREERLKKAEICIDGFASFMKGKGF
jgi:con80 domain of Katanin